MTGEADNRAAYGELADRIAAELRPLGQSGTPVASDPSTGFFGGPNVTFFQWLEHILCGQLRDVAAGRREPPPHSEVATAAARNLDGYEDTDRLLATLQELDSLVNGGAPPPPF